MYNVKSFSLSELEAYLNRLGEPAYRAGQLLSWVWKKKIDGILACTNLSKRLRERLEREVYIGSLTSLTRKASSDGTVKHVFARSNGQTIETVLIPSGKRCTVCVSCQVGCAVGCLFCATGRGGFRGNLEAWEIADQVLQVSRIEEVEVTNVVFMGMGEPLLNWTAVSKALELLNSDYGMDVGARRMTVSTAGIVPGIQLVARFPMQVRLAVSLNSAEQGKRENLMPIAGTYPLSQLHQALSSYYRQTHRMITLEYVLMGGCNTSRSDFEHLRTFVHGLKTKINLIPFNPIGVASFKRPTKSEVQRFYAWCCQLPCPVSIRESHGTDISGACGQLAGDLPMIDSVTP